MYCTLTILLRLVIYGMNFENIHIRFENLSMTNVSKTYVVDCISVLVMSIMRGKVNRSKQKVAINFTWQIELYVLHLTMTKRNVTSFIFGRSIHYFCTHKILTLLFGILTNWVLTIQKFEIGMNLNENDAHTLSSPTEHLYSFQKCILLFYG